MDNNTDQRQRVVVTGWPRRFVEWIRTGRDIGDLTGMQIAGIAAVVGLTAVSAVALMGWLLGQVVQLLGWLGEGATDANNALTSPQAAQLARVASDPIVAWAEHHAAGLAVSATTLLTVWAIGGGVLFLGGLGGARGARIAWPLYGAATAAMAWHGAVEPHRPIAAGLIALAWGVLSILVLHRGGSRGCTHITVPAAGEPISAPRVSASREPSGDSRASRHTEAFPPVPHGGGGTDVQR